MIIGERVKILVLNCGCSSVKYSVFEGGAEKASGLLERIGEKESEIGSHKDAIRLMADKLGSLDDVDAVGHRVVHGGDIEEPVFIDRKVTKRIESLSPLAPLHNPVNLAGIREMMRILPGVPQVAVFDTAFHQTMEESAFLYPLPYEYYSRDGIRRYGFHGTSHSFVAGRAAEILGKPPGKTSIITCHLGGGCSMAAIMNGRVIDTSMGFTPLDGLMMISRSGQIDPGIITYLAREKGMSPGEIDDVLNRRSGLLGISGKSKDMREIIKLAREGDRRSEIALEMFCLRVRKHIGAYAAEMDRIDAIVFTAGIGENEPLVRKMCCDVGHMDIVLDGRRNSLARGEESVISSPKSVIKVMVIPTDEEKKIAMETEGLLRKIKKK